MRVNPDAVKTALDRVPWKYRRWVIFGSLAWSMALVSFVVIVGDETTRSDIAFWLVGLIGSVIGTYVFGAAWDDQNARRVQLSASKTQNREDVPE